MRALLLVAVIGASSPAWAETVEIDFGSVVLVVSDSTTAHRSSIKSLGEGGRRVK